MKFRSSLHATGGFFMIAGWARQLPSLTPEVQARMMISLQAGTLNFNCCMSCLLTWRFHVKRLHVLTLAENWQDLTIGVMRNGYGEVLAYYYLDQAAQGLDYQRAAMGYYGYAFGRANGQNPLTKCEGGQSPANDPYQGVDLVNSIPDLVQA